MRSLLPVPDQLDIACLSLSEVIPEIHLEMELRVGDVAEPLRSFRTTANAEEVA